MKIAKSLSGMAAAVTLTLFTGTLQAQFAGNGGQDHFHDKSMLKPPAGSKVAVIVFEDLGCPGCAQAHPIEIQATQQVHVPLVRYDFPIAAHGWTFQGAVCARYIQDKISPQLAEQYRTDVFAAQRSIENKDDLQRFTMQWMARHGKQMPFVMDADGSLAKEVNADFALGIRLNLEQTPTVVVVTKDRYQVVCGTKDGANDPRQLPSVIRAAIEKTR